jgi:hypothetical protein
VWPQSVASVSTSVCPLQCVHFTSFTNMPTPSWRTTALNSAPAILGREGCEDGDSAAQAQRDRYFQGKMGAERRAFADESTSPVARRRALSREQLVEYGAQRSTGPAKGVLAELRRIDRRCVMVAPSDREAVMVGGSWLMAAPHRLS